MSAISGLHGEPLSPKSAAAQKEAEKALAEKSGEFEYSRAAAELAEAVAQLRTIQQLRNKVR